VTVDVDLPLRLARYRRYQPLLVSAFRKMQIAMAERRRMDSDDGQHDGQATPRNRAAKKENAGHKKSEIDNKKRIAR